MWIVAIALGLLAVGILAAGWVMAGYSMGIKRQTLAEARAWQESRYDLSWYDALNKQDYTVTADDGYVLHAQLLPCPAESDRCVIISHGYTDNRFGALKYARMWLDLGFHVVVYDLRGHGANAEACCTYSARESQDLDKLIQDCRLRFPWIETLGLQGESLGSAASIACLRCRPKVDFVVADCGFSEISSVLAAGLKSMKLPAFLLKAASLCAKLRYGYSYEDMRPIDSLGDNTVPILFIHGAADDFIPPSHSERMREATKGLARLALIPGAGHAVSILTAPEDYRRYVADFLGEIGVIDPANPSEDT